MQGSALRARLASREVAALIAAGVVVVLVGAVDVLAAAVLCVGSVGAIVAARNRHRRSLMFSLAGAVVVTTLVGTLVAVWVDVDRSRPTPLVVRSGDDPANNASLRRAVDARALLSPPPGSLTTLGFAATDYDDTPTGVDRAVPRLSIVAATGLTLGKVPGTLQSRSATDTLVRSHLGGAAAFLTLSNDNGIDFDPTLAMSVLGHRHATDQLIAALTTEIGRGGWDGVVIDFEQLPAAARAAFPSFLGAVRQALGTRPLIVSVPVFAANDPDARAYDLAAIGANVDRVALMTYDQHDPTGDPGPIGGLPWVKDVVIRAAAQVTPSKLMLGLAGYGYQWRSAGNAKELSFSDFDKLRADPRNAVAWDDVQAEWKVTGRNGEISWFEDARSAKIRADLANSAGLSGVAVWRLGSEDPATWTAIPDDPNRLHAAQPLGRPVKDTGAAGLVALTFDDGPDPLWTPKILEVLHREHVPATFFVIGERAQRYPDLVTAEVSAGDTVGNHTFSHPDLASQSTLRVKFEIVAGADVIEGITGRKPMLFRSPYGEGDAKSANKAPPDQIAQNLGFHSVGWNDDPEDWSRPGVSNIVRRSVSQASERTVILLHDSGGSREQTVAALPKLIHQLRAKGYLFTTVDALDAAVTTPYVQRVTLADRVRGVAIVAGFRMVRAAGNVVSWALVVIIILSLFRLLVGVPLALAHWRGTRHDRRGPPPPTPAISVTALVPAHNEQRVIAKTLCSLTAIDWPDLEVIVIDDGSIDGTRDIAESHGVRVIRQTQSGKAAALNAGIRAASGEVVVVIDADTVLDPGFLRWVLPHFANPDVVAVAGNVKVGNRSTLLSRLQALEYVVSLNLDRRAQARINSISVVPGAAGSFRRSSLLEVGGYPGETLVEDTDVTVALLETGGLISYEPSAIAWTEAPETARDVLKQRRRWSFGTVQVAAKRSDMLLSRKAGRLGLVGLPWMIVSQIILPIAGPLVDVYLLWLIVQGLWAQAAVMLLLSVGADFAVAAAAIAMDRERWSLLWWVPGLRVVWRPLQLAAVWRSAHLWLTGSHQTWRGVSRYGSVTLDGAAPSNAVEAAAETRARDADSASVGSQPRS